MTDQELLKQISNKLSALLAVSFIGETEKLTTADKLKMLVRFGLNNQEIADILGTTKSTVEVTKSRMFKTKKSYAK